MLSREEPKSELKRQGKRWLQETMKKTKGRLDKVHALYKKDYHTGLHKPRKVIHDDNYVYLRVKGENLRMK